MSCHNKNTAVWEVCKTEMYCLTVPEAKSPKTRFQWGWFPLKTMRKILFQASLLDLREMQLTPGCLEALSTEVNSVSHKCCAPHIVRTPRAPESYGFPRHKTQGWLILEVEASCIPCTMGQVPSFLIP